jgi:type IX secretion system PorP/SprF family membrane protein
MLINPAFTGHYEGDGRWMNCFRSQWKELGVPYNTLAIAGDRVLYKKGHKWAIGAQLTNDQSGGSLKIIHGQLYGAFHRKIKKQEFHGGLALGWISKSITPGNYTFPSQFNWTLGQFDAQLPQHEPLLNKQLGYVDASAGLAWSRPFRKITPLVGISAQHLTQASESFTNRSNNASLRLTTYLECPFSLSSKVTLSPRALYNTRSGATEVNSGLNFSYLLNAASGSTSRLSAGAYYRMNVKGVADAVIAMAGGEYKNIQVAVSYDFTISPLHIATYYQGAWEISLIFTSPSSRLTQIQVPYDRF